MTKIYEGVTFILVTLFCYILFFTVAIGILNATGGYHPMPGMNDYGSESYGTK